MKRRWKIILALSLLAIMINLGLIINNFLGHNTKGPMEGTLLYIPTGATFSQVEDSLRRHNLLRHPSAFSWLARRKDYDQKVKPGRYLIEPGMSSNELINRLMAGKQAPVRLVFNNIRTLAQLSGRLSKQLESDSLTLLNTFTNAGLLKDHGFTPATAPLLFIPNTYEVFWNIAPDRLLERMHREYKVFWTEQRKEKAESMGLDPVEVGILASIVEMETAQNDEKPTIAGVYVNRLRRGTPLEADPTIIFAWGDYSIRRVLKKHLGIDSPYNTYRHAGLPPGPISIPSIASIDAALNYQHHQYLFFCAGDDLSGHHQFASTGAQHMANARKYQQALNRMNIKK